jgi:hypothetical protein
MFQKTWKYLLVAFVITWFLLKQFGPQFFDMFGLITFGSLVIVALWGLYYKRKLPDYVLFSILVTGLFGILIDGVSSYQLLKSWMLGG